MSDSQKWQEQLVAMLYGELDAAEERELRLRLEIDAELRREWEELQEGRAWMTALETDVEVPSFVFLHDSREERQVMAAPLPQVREYDEAYGAGGSTAKKWWRSWAGPAWGAAAAVVMVGVLGLSGFRIQTVDGGLAFTFGDKAPRQETLAGANPSAQGSPAKSSIPTDGVQATPVSGQVGGQREQQSPAMTQDELLYMVGAMIEQRDRRRDQEMAAILQAMYQDVGARQEKNYQELQDQIRAMNVGMMLDRRGYENRLNNLEGEGVQSLDIPAGQPVDGQKEN